MELLAESEREMIEEGLRYYAWLPERVVVKVPLASEAAMRVLATLSARGVVTRAGQTTGPYFAELVAHADALGGSG